MIAKWDTEKYDNEAISWKEKKCVGECVECM